MYGSGGGYGQGQGFQQGPPGGYQQQHGHQGQPYGVPPANQHGAPPGNSYGSAPPGNPYGAAPAGNPYGAPANGSPYGGASAGRPPYGGAPSGGSPYGGAPAGGSPYGGAPSGGSPYGGAPAGGSPYGGAPAGSSPYGGAPQRGAPPGQYGGHGGQPFQGGYGAPAPPPGVDPQVWGWFQSVDTDRSGRISATELQSALTNNNWSHFNGETCRLMIGMFDRNRNGMIDVNEFSALWKYVQDWKQCFDGFDRDRSGTIDADELTQAFRGFGYNLSPQFSHLCVRVFDRASNRTMKLDDFIQCCVMLKTLTDKFREKDTQRNGLININYEQFLEMVLDTTLAQGK